MSSKILPLFPQHFVYVEPFCGGATMLFARDYNEKCIEVINDTNGDVVNFFKVLRDDGEKLCENLELTLYSQQEYQLAVDQYKNQHEIDPLERARLFFVNIMQSYSNKLCAGWGTTIYRNKYFAKSSSCYSCKINNLQNYISRMRGVHISCEDAIRCIDRWDSPDTFFYCDPPYINTHQGHYGGYKQDDLQNLICKLDSIQGSFVLSGYACDLMPENWERFEFDSIMSCARDKKADKKRTEIVWRKLNAVHAPKQMELFI